LPNESRPAYLAEINVENCKVKKIMDLDSVNIRDSKDLVLDRKTNKIFILHNYGGHSATISEIDLNNKKIESSIILSKEIPWNVPNFIFNQPNQFLQYYRDNGILLLVRRDTIFEFNYYTKIWKKVWRAGNLFSNGIPGANPNIPIVGFNTIWYKGNLLYFAIADGLLKKIHLNQDSLVTTYIDSIGISNPIGGSLSNGSPSCDTSIIHSIIPNYKNLYTVNLENQTSKKNCSNPLFEHIKATVGIYEHISSNCAPLIDLDNNNSTDTTKNNYTSPIICEPKTPIPLNDNDLVVNSGDVIDSLVCFIQNTEDGNSEQLIFTGTPHFKIKVKGNLSKRFVLQNKSTAKSLDFRAVLSNVFYQNTKTKFTQGDRLVSFILYSGNEKSETALARLILRRNEAGQDSVATLCSNQPVSLNDYLKGNNHTLGDWYPSLASGTAIFNPQKDKYGKYTYVINNGGFCVDDSATIDVKKADIVIKKNIDTTLCFDNTLIVNNKTYKNKGIYTDIIRSKSGCDSLEYTIKINVRKEAKTEIDTILIEGASYTIDKQVFNTKGDFSIKIKNKYGCDSTILLRIDLQSSNLRNYIPSVFTPESNDENSFFRLLETTPIKSVKKMYVFNRWGQMVFKAENVAVNSMDARWDGKFNNVLQASDVYIYHLEVEKEKSIQQINGQITLLR
jgi:gliding motility-associated-like protein